MKPVALHIGSTKTGTSSLQRYFAHQAGELLEEGVCYPTAGRRAPGLLAHHNLCYEKQDGRVRTGVFRPEVGTWGEALAEIDDSSASLGIVSSEAFMNCRPNQVGGFGNEMAGREARVIVYVRRQDRWMQSAWNQQARFGRCSLDFWEFYAQVRRRARGDYHQMLVPWVDTFGDDHVHVRNFDSLRSEIVEDFFSAVKPGFVAPTPSEPPARVNTMAGAVHLVAVSRIVEACRAQLGSDFSLATSSAIRIAEFFRGRPGRDERFSVLSHVGALRVHADFSESNQLMADRFPEFARSGGFPQPQPAEYGDHVDVANLSDDVFDTEERRFVQRMTREIVRTCRAGKDESRHTVWRGGLWRRRKA